MQEDIVKGMINVPTWNSKVSQLQGSRTDDHNTNLPKKSRSFFVLKIPPALF